MQIDIHEYGIDELLHRLDTLGNPAQSRAVRRRALRAGILVVDRRAKGLLVGTRTGRTYSIRGKAHVASAPGEPPAVDTGNLKNSLRVLEVTDDYASYGTSADYAADLEYGSRRMAARPFLRPAVEAGVGEIQETMTAVIDEALDGR